MRRAFPILARAVACALAAVVLVVVPGSTVSAHTDLASTSPADGAVAPDPVAEVIVSFTNPVTPVGNGFEVLDPAGNVLQPVAVSDDGAAYRLPFDPPLAGGTVGVRYEVTAQDGHVISGSFSFTAAAAPVVAAPVVAAPVTAAPVAAAPVAAAPITAAPPVETPVAIASATTAPVTVPGTMSVLADESPSAASVPSPVDDDSGGSGVFIAITVAIAIGASAFLALRARRPDIES